MDTASDLSTVLVRSVLFHGTQWDDLQELIAGAEVIGHKARETIIRENDLVTGLHVILKGRVEIVKGGRNPLAVLQEGNFFGEISFFGQSICATADVIAATDCTLMVFQREMLNLWLSGHPGSEAGFFRNLAGELCGRLHSTTEKAFPGA